MNAYEKTREALEQIAKLMDRILVRTELDDEIHRIALEAQNMADGVLLLSPRNCDVGTAEERMHRYQALCREIDERHERFGEHAPVFAFPTPFAWEDRPYESEVKK